MNIQSTKLVYFSPTGTTKRITNEIAQAIHTKRVKVIDCTKPAIRAGESLTFYDELVILGTPVHYRNGCAIRREMFPEASKLKPSN